MTLPLTSYAGGNKLQLKRLFELATEHLSYTQHQVAEFHERSSPFRKKTPVFPKFADDLDLYITKQNGL